MSGAASLEQLLAGLRREYLRDLPGKIAQLRAQMESGATPEDLREAFHKLKGTGKTYGLPEVSLVGEISEQICEALPDVAKEAATLALEILSDVHRSRTQGAPAGETAGAAAGFDVATDSRYERLQALLSQA